MNFKIHFDFMYFQQKWFILRESHKERKIQMAVLELTKENFDNIINGDKAVLVDFWAPWCGPCRMQGPIVDALAEESDGSFVVGKVNIDEDGDIASRYGIMSIPTILVFKNGEVKNNAVGLRGKDELKKMLNV